MKKRKYVHQHPLYLTSVVVFGVLLVTEPADYHKRGWWALMLLLLVLAVGAWAWKRIDWNA